VSNIPNLNSNMQTYFSEKKLLKEVITKSAYKSSLSAYDKNIVFGSFEREFLTYVPVSLRNELSKEFLMF
jgi:hypothetical protein